MNADDGDERLDARETIDGLTRGVYNKAMFAWSHLGGDLPVIVSAMLFANYITNNSDVEDTSRRITGVINEFSLSARQDVVAQAYLHFFLALDVNRPSFDMGRTRQWALTQDEMVAAMRAIFANSAEGLRYVPPLLPGASPEGRGTTQGRRSSCSAASRAGCTPCTTRARSSCARPYPEAASSGTSRTSGYALTRARGGA